LNFLAHSFLSGPDEALLVGNFIADSVKGRQKEKYTPEIQRGIILHRQIDTFTDAHPIVQQTKARLRPGYGKFSGVISDMFYDHFLAANFKNYSAVPLLEYTHWVYGIMQKYRAQLPERVHYFLPYMVRQNWLYNYAQVSGIQKSLQGLSQRSNFTSNMATATEELEAFYALYQTDFERFFPDLQRFVKQQIN
jgi:acyl carrier protein phosphodiesterase